MMPKSPFNFVKSMERKLALYEDLVSRLSIECGELHHNPSEYHKSNESCPVMEKFKEILRNE